MLGGQQGLVLHPTGTQQGCGQHGCGQHGGGQQGVAQIVPLEDPKLIVG